MSADDLHGQPRPTPEQVAWVFHHLNEHYEGGGSFRYLIYDRLGFDQSAYVGLCGQGMHLSNLLACSRESSEVSKALLEIVAAFEAFGVRPPRQHTVSACALRTVLYAVRACTTHGRSAACRSVCA